VAHFMLDSGKVEQIVGLGLPVVGRVSCRTTGAGKVLLQLLRGQAASVAAADTHLPCRVFQLSQLCPEENLDKLIPCLAGPDSFYVERNHVDLEAGLR
jgi:hypothetical protein